MTRSMTLRRVPAGRGMRWIRDGALAVLRYPIGFASLFATGFFAFVVLGFVPFYLGQLLFLALMPAGTLVFMVASRFATEQRSPLPAAFTDVMHAPLAMRIELAKLGVAAMFCMLAAMLLAHVLDHGVLWRFIDQLAQMQGRAGIAPSAAVDLRVQWAVLLQAALMVVALIPLWHAPALIHWGGYGWAPSMFFSIIAIWRNKGAFAVYGFTWFALMMTSSLVLIAAAAVLGPAVATFPLLVTGLFGWTLFFATRYFTFADCFEPVAERNTPPPG